jgi:hypothetical protein
MSNLYANQLALHHANYIRGKICQVMANENDEKILQGLNIARTIANKRCSAIHKEVKALLKKEENKNSLRNFRKEKDKPDNIRSWRTE